MSVSKHLMCVNLFSFYNHSAIFIPVEQIKNNNNNNNNNLSSGYLWRRKWQPTPGILPGKFHGQRSLAGYKSMGLQKRNDLATKQQHAILGSLTHLRRNQRRLPGGGDLEVRLGRLTVAIIVR